MACGAKIEVPSAACVVTTTLGFESAAGIGALAVVAAVVVDGPEDISKSALSVQMCFWVCGDIDSLEAVKNVKCKRSDD